MAHVAVEAHDHALDDPVLLDGLPGIGLIGKLVADHVVAEFEMEYHAGVYCDGVPSVAAYRTNESAVRPPVQFHAAPEHDLLAMTSDVPISSSDAPEFAACVTDWFEENSVTPIYLSGLSESGYGSGGAPPRELYGLSTGDGDALLDEAGIVQPRHAGIVSGPTGALLHRAAEVSLDGVGLLVRSNEDVPDVEAARLVVEQGVAPIAGVEIDVEPFVDRTVEMSPVTQSFLETVQDDATTRAEPTPTFH